VTEDSFLAKGKRGEVFLREQRGTTVLVKRKNPTSVVDTIANEARFTAILNVEGVGPRFISYNDGELVREYVKGTELRKWLPDATKKQIIPVLVSVLKQCKVMDDLNVTKEEMTRPWKHIIITESGKATLIDFERCKETLAPKNVSQYCQFLMGTRIGLVLKSKKIVINNKKILEIIKQYKQNIKSNDRKKNEQLFAQLVEVVQDA